MAEGALFAVRGSWCLLCSVLTYISELLVITWMIYSEVILRHFFCRFFTLDFFWEIYLLADIFFTCQLICKLGKKRLTYEVIMKIIISCRFIFLCSDLLLSASPPKFSIRLIKISSQLSICTQLAALKQKMSTRYNISQPAVQQILFVIIQYHWEVSLRLVASIRPEMFRLSSF